MKRKIKKNSQRRSTEKTNAVNKSLIDVCYQAKRVRFVSVVAVEA
jgi:hypothetical protein